jgi:asparagine synthase (glutamine-hydrolysing)
MNLEKNQIIRDLEGKILDFGRDIKTDNIGLAFSGGVDSSILAKVLKDEKKNITLFTVSFCNDEDINFSKEIAKRLNLKILSEIVTIKNLEDGLKIVLNNINFERLVRLENCVGFYYIFKLASRHGIKNVFSANGADELFCGYHIFANSFSSRKIEDLMVSLVKIAKKDKKEIDKIAAIFDINYFCPFLSEKFIDFALKIPVIYKMKNESDKLRKTILRSVALKMGVPSSAVYKPKKAFQYSSGLHKAIIKLTKRKGFTKKNAVKNGFSSSIEAYINSLK